jgi:hypothetical protein
MTRRIHLLVFSIFVLTSLAARAENSKDDWKKEFTTSGKLSLKVESNDASITVTSWDRKETSVEVTTDGYKIGPNDVRVTDRQAGNQVDIEVHRPSGHVCFGVCNRSIHIEAHVPQEADLALSTRDGNIRVLSVKGDLRLDSGDGNLDIRSANGRLSANTGDGHVSAEGRFDALDVHTGDGDINVEVDSASVLNSGWTLRTGDGNISMRIPPNFSADLDARSGDGRVNVEFPVTIEGSMRENGIRGKINAGGQTIELRTGDGNIDLRKG